MTHSLERYLASRGWKTLAVITLTLVFAGTAVADGGVTYSDVTSQVGVDFARTPSPRLATKADITSRGPIETQELLMGVRFNEYSQKGSGTPGVAVLDFDGDGDLDFYVTNGPGAANSLYSSQLVESGQLTFVDVAAAAGVEATSQDSSGVCYGDIDNDGDQDLFVLGIGDDPPNPLYSPTGTTNLLFENDGDGTFTDITASAGVAGAGAHSVGCSFGDVDNDGYLDVVVANTYDNWGHMRPTFINEFYPGYEHNYLYRNNGDNTFADVSASSGIESVSNMPDAAFSWAIAMADLNQDGAIDILSVDNQGGRATQRSEESGWLRYYQNDGAGQMTEVTEAAGLDYEGGWMGSSFGDLNCDGHMDFFATNLGNYLNPIMPSDWFLGQPDGSFVRPGLGPAIVADPFGWGTSMYDYDNDADADILYHGGVDVLNIFVAENPGIIFQNTGDCSAQMVWDSGAIQKDHRPRGVNGVATGDLNGDGFADVVSVSNQNVVPVNFFPITIVSGGPLGSPFDAVGRFELQYFGGSIPGFQVWLDPTFEQGDVVVELNSADNGNNWAEFTTLGGKGVIPQGTANRDGIGAIVSFTPDGGPTSLYPVLGGSSYGSQHDLTLGFGLGPAAGGTVEVSWPGGVKNRLYGVQAGESLLLPEIPCSFDADWGNFGQYNSCVMQALNGYKDAGHITSAQRNRLRDSARQAFHDSQ
jgi:enediyne biosynthesis protein E4